MISNLFLSLLFLSLLGLKGASQVMNMVARDALFETSTEDYTLCYHTTIHHSIPQWTTRDKPNHRTRVGGIDKGAK